MFFSFLEFWLMTSKLSVQSILLSFTFKVLFTLRARINQNPECCQSWLWWVDRSYQVANYLQILVVFFPFRHVPKLPDYILHSLFDLMRFAASSQPKKPMSIDAGLSQERFLGLSRFVRSLQIEDQDVFWNERCTKTNDWYSTTLDIFWRYLVFLEILGFLISTK